MLARLTGHQTSNAESLGAPDLSLRLVTPPYMNISQLQKARPKEMPKHTDAGWRCKTKRERGLTSLSVHSGVMTILDFLYSTLK